LCVVFWYSISTNGEEDQWCAAVNVSTRYYAQ